MENSKMYTWSSNDIVRSAVTSIFVAVVAVLYGLTTQAGFDVFSADWVAIGKMVVNAVIITFMGRMGEKFVTNGNGKVFGRLG